MTVCYEEDRPVEFRDDSELPVIEKSGLIRAAHGFSTRLGGVSEGCFSSLNLGMNRGDIPERVKENWRRFMKACGAGRTGSTGNTGSTGKGAFDTALVWGRQVHGNHVHIATREDLRAAGENEPLLEADGYVTAQAGVPIAVFTADCVPVLLEDAVHGVIGAVHSGWRSTVADIGREAVEKMLLLGADTGEIHVAIGAAIDSCCFEVGVQVVVAVEELLGQEIAREFYRTRGDKFMLDLRGVVRQRFLQLGILPQNIELVGGCTMCNPGRYWSHRYTKGERGSQAAMIMM